MAQSNSASMAGTSSTSSRARNPTSQRKTAAAKDRISGLRDRVLGADSASQSPGERIGSVSESMQSKVQGSPIGLGLLAFGAGMVLSALIPASDTEARVSRQAVATAKEHGAPIADAAKSAGQDMVEQLKDSATEAAHEVRTLRRSPLRESGTKAPLRPSVLRPDPGIVSVSYTVALGI
jgi:hypothetical protein